MRTSFLAMRTDGSASEAAQALMQSDMRELGLAARKLANHAMIGLSGGLGLGILGSIFKWLAFAAAVYLLVLDRTNWKTKMLTGLLIPYIFFTLPSVLFNIIRGEIGAWIAFVAVIVQLFFPQHFRDYLEMPSALILLTVVAPSLIADTFRNDFVGVGVCLVIGCYLLQEHIRASGGFKPAFSRANGISNSIGIALLFIYPVWALITMIF